MSISTSCSPNAPPASKSGARSSMNWPAKGLGITAAAATRTMGFATARPISENVVSRKRMILRGSDTVLSRRSPVTGQSCAEQRRKASGDRSYRAARYFDGRRAIRAPISHSCSAASKVSFVPHSRTFAPVTSASAQPSKRTLARLRRRVLKSTAAIWHGHSLTPVTSVRSESTTVPSYVSHPGNGFDVAGCVCWKNRR